MCSEHDRRFLRVLAEADEGRLKAILLVVTALEELDASHTPYRDAMKLVARTSVRENATLMRLFAVASDVLTWEDWPEYAADEFQRYVRPAWNVLADEIEYLTESRCERFGAKRRLCSAYPIDLAMYIDSEIDYDDPIALRPRIP